MKPRFGLSHWLRRPSLWMGLGGLALSLVPILELERNTYPPAVAAQSTLVFFVITPAIAAAAAWEASRFKSFTSPRGVIPVKILMDRILPFSLLLPFGYLASFMYQTVSFSSFNSTMVLLVFYSWLVGLCWVLIGAFLGVNLRPVVAVFSAGIVAYIWYALVPSAAPGVLRRITGDFLACCSLDATLDKGAVLSAALGILGFSALVIAASFLLRLSFQDAEVLAAIGCTLTVLSFFQASSVDPYGIEARDVSELQCAEGCVRGQRFPKRM